jgi:hypothetical protein
MTEYWVKVDISRRDALKTLDELADPRSKLRRQLQSSKRSALRALAERGIDVAEASLPDKITLPPPEEIAQLKRHALRLVAKDRKPFGFFVIAACFGAMPLVDAPD